MALFAGCSDDDGVGQARTNSFKDAKELEDLRQRNQDLEKENSRLKLIVHAHTVRGDDMVLSEGVWYLDMHRKPFTGRAVNKYKDGSVKDEVSFLKGKMDGVERAHHPNGQVKLERQWLNGELHGYATEWDAKGKILRRQRFERNKEVGGP